MIKNIKAENYKSIKTLELELGRANVFIGENGAGKSNILEVFALAGAAVAWKLDNEFLASRGIRVANPEFMRPAFSGADLFSEIRIAISADVGEAFLIKLKNDNSPYSKWVVNLEEEGDVISPLLDAVSEWLRLSPNLGRPDDDDQFESNIEILHLLSKLHEVIKNRDEGNGSDVSIQVKNSDLARLIEERRPNKGLRDFIGQFVVFSPENSALKIFEREGQIEPLGINGEGLLKLLSVLSKENNGETLQEIKSSLQVLGWFEDFKLVDGDTFAPSRIAIKDRYIEDGARWFDQMSANEGFLFLLFYFALFSTKLTPSIFAIDNIDASLNPALCEKLLRELVRLAKKNDKQVLLTTHNPAVLDGLNLHDDEQRLFVVSRGRAGETRVRRIQMKPQNPDKERPVRLSEMFLRGSLGGIPKGF